ncbi:hypothetical protein U14_05101 [Candidatus Moduliflexus flocculans]|uniref:Uncharacterized protein n=1 Tax=Candidatus Moduliflexus flocculans TaxID=1499966 RepID=A0A081BQZ6_9BACT|nr:hypothetical protein U14_05101 [Candidatus Moduliflexus flocculans]
MCIHHKQIDRTIGKVQPFFQLDIPHLLAKSIQPQKICAINKKSYIFFLTDHRGYFLMQPVAKNNAKMMH